MKPNRFTKEPLLSEKSDTNILKMGEKGIMVFLVESLFVYTFNRHYLNIPSKKIKSKIHLFELRCHYIEGRLTVAGGLNSIET